MGISNVSNGLRSGVCTSTTRPTAPYEGQMIYETDTDLTFIWGGSAWQQVSGSTAVGNSGLVYITQYVISGTTASIQINSCFTSTYENYHIVLSNISGTSANQTVNARLSSGGTPTATGYDCRGYYVTFGGGSGITGRSTTEFSFSGIDNSNKVGASIELQNPATPNWTTMQTNYTNYDAWVSQAGRHAVNTSYDGLYLVPTAGSFSTGSIRIYGYRQA